MTEAPVIKKHIAERFLDWYPYMTRLYVRGHRNADWAKAKQLEQELFDALVPFFEMYRNEVLEEAAQEVDDYSEYLPDKIRNLKR